MRLFWSIALALGLVLGGMVYTAGQKAPSHDVDTFVRKESCDMSTPRRTFRAFLYGIHHYNHDSHTGFECLSRAIETPEDAASGIYRSDVVKRARNMLLLLENMDFDLDTDVPDDVVGDSVSFSLKYEDQPVNVTMLKGKDGWYFPNELFKDPKLVGMVKELRERYKKFTTETMEGDTFVQSLMSPYRTFFTFTSGFEEPGYDIMDSAVQALDMSEFSSLKRPLYGPMYAVMLYRIITFRSNLKLEELSANPNTTHPPVFLVVPGLGSITMHVVTEENGRKAWKFTPHSLTVAIESYDDIMQDLLQSGINPLVGEQLPLHARIDDFIHRNAPGLLVKYLGTNLYKWLVLFVLFLVTPVVVKCIGFVGNKLLDLIESRLPEGMEPLHRRGFIWPVEVMVVGLLWLQAVVLLVLYQDLMMACLYGLNTLMTIAVVWVLVMTVNLFSEVLVVRSAASVRATMMLITAQILKIVFILMGLVHIAGLFGQDSTRIMAAMGIGGVALALAGKDTLENIFGTLVIMATRPFAVGDWISMNNMDGTVEKVGVRSTSIRTFYNSELIIPNARFITTPVDNMGRREWRRYNTTIRVAYDTPLENLNGYVQGLRQLVLNHPLTRKTDFHIVANDFGSSSIDIMVYIFFKTEDWAQELRARHEFIVDALRLAEELKIAMAVPATTVHLRQGDPEPYPRHQSDSQAESVGRNAANSIRPVKAE